MHGDESGSVDRNHNVPGHRLAEGDQARASRERELMDQAPYVLNEVSPEGSGRKRWARHGSTRWLLNRDDVAAAIRYVVDRQGEPMAFWIAEQ